MSVTIQASGIFSGRPEETGYGIQGANKTQKQIFAGNLNLMQDPVAEKRRQAQQKALKIVKDAWENDKAVEREVTSRKEQYAALSAQRQEKSEELKDIHMDEKVLKELYGVTDDSKEQQDLELLKKRQDYYNRVGEAPSKEEWEQLAQIDKQPLTEYQQRALQLNGRSGVVRKEMNDIGEKMQIEVQNVKSILLEKLKSDPMVDAQKAAASINEAANEKIIGMLVQEATDYIDEQLEEAEEKAEKKAEKDEEKEELQEKIELKRAVQEALIEQTEEAVERAKAKEQEQETPEMDFDELLDITRKNPASEDAQRELNDIKNSMKLVEADLKGIKVDEEI
ncbi:MAG: HD-GYP domain protein [Clostridiales bacterium]|nr:HD-GYP domain protein [Clostridiales bacterium]